MSTFNIGLCLAGVTIEVRCVDVRSLRLTFRSLATSSSQLDEREVEPATWYITSCRIGTVVASAGVEAVIRISPKYKGCQILPETTGDSCCNDDARGRCSLASRVGCNRSHLHRLCASRRRTRFAPWSSFRFSAHPDIQTEE